jgi:hypothetical protein
MNKIPPVRIPRNLVRTVPSNVVKDYVDHVKITIYRDVIYDYDEIPAEYDKVVSALKLCELWKARLERRFKPTTFEVKTEPGKITEIILVDFGANMPKPMTDSIYAAITSILANLAKEPKPKTWWVKPDTKDWKRIVLKHGGKV